MGSSLTGTSKKSNAKRKPDLSQCCTRRIAPHKIRGGIWSHSSMLVGVLAEGVFHFGHSCELPGEGAGKGLKTWSEGD